MMVKKLSTSINEQEIILRTKIEEIATELKQRHGLTTKLDVLYAKKTTQAILGKFEQARVMALRAESKLQQYWANEELKEQKKY